MTTTNIQYSATIQAAQDAANFRRDRQDVDLPVATDDQIKRAQRLIAQNPMLRRRNTPLGIQQLAMELPLSKRERRVNRLREEDGGIGLTLQPSVFRGTEGEVRAPIDRVREFVQQNLGLSDQELGLSIAGQAGYDGRGLGIALRRVNRWADSPGADRPCGHIRGKARMLDAIALAVAVKADIIKEQAEAEAAAQTEVQTDGE